MAPHSSKPSAPLTFDLPLGLIGKLQAVRRARGLRNTSEAVRLAIEQFDFGSCKPSREPHRQISVRITGAQRAILRRYAKAKDTSVGELLRLALEAIPVRPARSRR